ncbi:hypothetical protein [uncultured Methylobacterium sp.]
MSAGTVDPGRRGGRVFHVPVEAWHAAGFDTETVLVETNLPV